MGMVIQAGGGDADEYSVRGTVKSVQPFTEFLGQSGWRLQVTIMRVEDEDSDLEIVVTGRAWRDRRRRPPTRIRGHCLAAGTTLQHEVILDGASPRVVAGKTAS